MTKEEAAIVVKDFLEYLQEGDVRLCQLEDGPDGAPQFGEVEQSITTIVTDYVMNRNYN